ncbi:hypothetical protein CapIbe_008417 [Capra ibex]
MSQVQGLESTLNVAVSEGVAGDLDSLPSPMSSKPLRGLPKHSFQDEDTLPGWRSCFHDCQTGNASVDGSMYSFLIDEKKCQSEG